MNEYTPDYWQIIKITSTEGEVLYKVFASWVGGYTTGDSWRMNSGITEVKFKGDYLLFKGHSGSVYKVVNKERAYRTSMYTQSVLESMMKKCDLIGAEMEVLPYSDDFKNMFWSSL